MTLSAKLTSWFIRGKDSSASLLARKAMDRVFARYGTMIRLNIDSQRKSIELEVLLKGETEPLAISIQEYEVTDEDATCFVLLKKASASREWLDLLLNDFLLGKKLAIPPNYAGVVKMLL